MGPLVAAEDALRQAVDEAKRIARVTLLDEPFLARPEDTKGLQRKLYWATHCLTAAELAAVLVERDKKIWAAAQRAAYAKTWDHAVRSRLRRARLVLQHHFSWPRR